MLRKMSFSERYECTELAAGGEMTEAARWAKAGPGRQDYRLALAGVHRQLTCYR